MWPGSIWSMYSWGISVKYNTKWLQKNTLLLYNNKRRMEAVTMKISILGATGYTGEELLRILANHPEAQIQYLTLKTRQGHRLTKYIRICSNSIMTS